MYPRTYTDDQLITAVKESSSIAQVLKKLKLKPAGGTYTHIKKLIKRMNLDCSHFLGQSWSKDRSNLSKIPIQSLLCYGTTSNSSHLKKRLFNEGFFDRKCYGCGGTEWRNQPIPLELEHKDGNKLNNHLDNLTILCPNCHAQTPTYRRRKSSL